MTYFGPSAVGWAAWTAIGTLALACATVAAIVVTLLLARNDMRQADAQRLAEIKRDDDRRADDRARGDERRAQDRDRDDRLGREAAEERENREAAERQAREDYEARQVVVRTTPKADAKAWLGQEAQFTHQITVSTPHHEDLRAREARGPRRRAGCAGPEDRQGVNVQMTCNRGP